MDFPWSFYFPLGNAKKRKCHKVSGMYRHVTGTQGCESSSPQKIHISRHIEHNTFQNISWYQDSLEILGSNFLLVIVPPKMCRRNIFCKRPFAILLVPKRRPAMCHWHVSAKCQLFMCPFIATIFSFPFICVIISHLFWFTAFASQYNVYCGRGRASLQVWPLTKFIMFSVGEKWLICLEGKTITLVR